MRATMWSRTAVAALFWVGIAGCAGAGGPSSRIEQGELVGVWSNSAGARLEFGLDHGFSATGLNHALPYDGCAATVTAGRWQFYVPVGTSSSDFDASESATAGKSLSLKMSDKFDTFECDLEADIQQDSSGLNLCLVQDPDQTCTAEELVRKDTASRAR
ncbi:hypothetical protein ACH5AL_29165 [Actinacidiphila glaucinigra]|uniref:hypothetical protein n=1 Tax=Actinacidiphila glaucinigra TaxID=235986 RepID=UPI0037AE3CE1